ncbi:4-demethylwyosine synthase TYW1 [Candidatus Woesearchaeota archaeon]|nr:4-demethylwyosine synthase TYW1 [Candidatus Woesearchaeota archaeon]
MITKGHREELERQQYRIVGEHSAVKVCHWTKQALRGQGMCYKFTFYGIRSHQCMQMSTSLSCANRCVFCWRGTKAPVSKEWRWGVDDAEKVFEGSLLAHKKLLTGFGGNDKVKKTILEQARQVKHVALSLTGEPIIYPKINEFVKLCNKEGISTFMVTNGQYPEAIRDLSPVTQLYMSLDAPTKDLLKEIDIPLFADFWERMEKSLDYLAEKKHRTCIRITLIKDLNDNSLEEYAKHIKRADVDFIEVKAYMFIGESRQRLEEKNMPLHEEVVEFTKRLNDVLEDYDIVSEHIPSRVVMLAKKKYHKKDGWHTWIDFEEWNRSLGNKDYSAKTPAHFVGISGKGTKDVLEKEEF